jgi:hypothetical protein
MTSSTTPTSTAPALTTPTSTTPCARGLAAVWALALLFAVINGLFALRRAPIMHRETTPDERAAQAAAVWLRQQPAGARLLLLRSRKDLGAVWFNFRLNYLIYPRRHDSAWEIPSPGTAQTYDLILAIGAARAKVSPDWRPLQRTDFATLYASTIYGAPKADLPPQPVPLTPFGLLAGLFSIAAVILLGTLLLGWSVPVAPFRHWWANLALAHLVGATAVTWLVIVTAMVTHKLLVWPVYLLLLLLLPGLRRAGSHIFPGSRVDAVGGAHDEVVSPLLGESQPSRGIGSSTWRRLALCAVIALGGIMWLVNAREYGVGWDGYSIWQFKAQAFLHDGDLAVLHDRHFVDYAHLDYPLLVPLQTWWAGAHAGGYRELWAQAIGGLFALDLLALFAAFAGQWVSREAVLCGVALVATLPVLAGHAVSGFADIEMACWLLALAVFVARVAITGERTMWPALAWIFAGIVLVKNEGLLASLTGAITLLSVQRRRNGQGLIGCLACAGAAYLPWFALKRVWHLTNDLLEGGRNPHFTVRLLIWRFGVALRGFAHCLAQVGPRAGGWGLMVLLLPIGLVETLRRRIVICLPLWLLGGLQMFGYVLIYLITPKPIQVHLDSSVDRLTLHLVPTLLMAALLATFGTAETGVRPT